MYRRLIPILAAVALLAATAGCARLQPPPQPGASQLQFQAFHADGAIPAEYGKLVAVTSSDTFPGWAQLWFEKADQTIVTVFVNYQDGSVRDKILVIPRT